MAHPLDWLKHLRREESRGHAELDLTILRPGDILRVITGHTHYTLEMKENRYAELSTNRPDRPSGRVLIQGCTYGLSTTIKPDRLFTGGSLEFTYRNGEMVHTTTAITELQLLQRS